MSTGRRLYRRYFPAPGRNRKCCCFGRNIVDTRSASIDQKIFQQPYDCLRWRCCGYKSSTPRTGPRTRRKPECKTVLIPDKEDPDSYVNKVGASAFTQFVQRNKKDFILFQLEVALKDAGNDSVKKAEVVSKVAETISRINKAEDFTKQQDY